MSLQSGQREGPGLEVVCTNPAALAGGAAALDSSFPAAGQSVAGAPVTTPWVTYPDRYTAECEHADGATWLEVRPVVTPGDPRPRVRAVLGRTWGLHLDDVNLAMVALVDDVATEAAALGG